MVSNKESNKESYKARNKEGNKDTPKSIMTEFDKLKRRIDREFKKKKLIGDITISEAEYALLIVYLNNNIEELRIHMNIRLMIFILQRHKYRL